MYSLARNVTLPRLARDVCESELDNQEAGVAACITCVAYVYIGLKYIYIYILFLCPDTVLSTPCWLRASNQYCITFTLTEPVGCEPASNVALYSNSVRWRARQPVGCEPYAPMMPTSMLISQAWIGSIWSMIGKYMIGGCT